MGKFKGIFGPLQAYSTYLPIIFKYQKGSIEAQNFLIITSWITKEITW